MYQVYNMGHRLEIFCKSAHENTVLDIAKSLKIDAQVIGRTESSDVTNGKNQLDIKIGNETLKYE